MKGKNDGIAVLSTLLLLTVGLLTEPAGAESLTADEIVRRVNARDEGEAVTRTLEMSMTDRRGRERTRLTRGFRKYYGEEKRSVIFYLEPANIQDTAFLTFDYPDADKDDDQWLYLPALRKVRRISAADRGDYFLGTQLTYEDIKKEGKLSPEDFEYRLMGEEEVDGRSTIVVEGSPRSPEIADELGYGRTLLRVDAEIWMVRKAEFWDVAGNPLKTLHTREIRRVDGIWTAHRLEVQNHKTGHGTVFQFRDVDYDSAVEDDWFTERALRRGL